MAKLSIDGGNTFLEGNEIQEQDARLLSAFADLVVGDIAYEVGDLRSEFRLNEFIAIVNARYQDIEQKFHSTLTMKDKKLRAIREAFYLIKNDIVFDKRMIFMTSTKKASPVEFLAKTNKDYVISDDVDENVYVSVSAQ